MLTKTTEAGIQLLIYLATSKSGVPVSPRTVAASLDLSPSYLAKVAGQLVRANILTAHRGVKGGVTLSEDPASILLLDIVQALQGVIVGDFCKQTFTPRARVCGFHAAMAEVHRATLDILRRWTLADLAARPVPKGVPAASTACVMKCLGKAPADSADRVSRTRARDPGEGRDV